MDQMCLQNPQTIEERLVLRAREVLDELIRDEVRGSGDTENAIRRIAKRMKVGFNPLWSIKYRPPKTVSAGLWLTLEEENEDLREKQLRKFQEAEAAGGRDGWLSKTLARHGARVAGQLPRE